jgi:hypothetical protein
MALIATKYAQSIDAKIDSSLENLATANPTVIFPGTVDRIASLFAD